MILPDGRDMRSGIETHKVFVLVTDSPMDEVLKDADVIRHVLIISQRGTCSRRIYQSKLKYIYLFNIA